MMTHGDLVPGHVLIDGGPPVGLLDGGRIGPADPAMTSSPRGISSTVPDATDSEPPSAPATWTRERGRARAFAQAMAHPPHVTTGKMRSWVMDDDGTAPVPTEGGEFDDATGRTAQVAP